MPYLVNRVRLIHSRVPPAVGPYPHLLMLGTKQIFFRTGFLAFRVLLSQTSTREPGKLQEKATCAICQDLLRIHSWISYLDNTMADAGGKACQALILMSLHVSYLRTEKEEPIPPREWLMPTDFEDAGDGR